MKTGVNDRVLFNHICLIFGSAFVLAFFSELYFMNGSVAFAIIEKQNQPAALIYNMFELGLWYSVVAALFIFTITYFNVRNLWALFLAGCVFGYMTEGLVVPAMYFELPYAIFWTALSWHPLICIVLGWYGFRMVMQRGHVPTIIMTALIMGVLWGAWNTYMVNQPLDEGLTLDMVFENGLYPALSFGQFLAYAGVSTMILIMGLFLIDISSARELRPHKVINIIYGLLAGMFALLIFLMVQWLFFVFVAGIAIFCIGLWRNKKSETRDSVLAEITPIKFTHYPILLLMPLSASVTYTVMVQNEILVASWIVTLPLMILGVAFLVVSFVRLFGGKGV